MVVYCIAFQFFRKGFSMIRLCLLLTCMSLAQSVLSAEGATAIGKIVVDASKDGGVWTYPQPRGSFDPTKDHQGKALADYLRSQGWDLEEIPPGEDITERLNGATVVIRTSAFFTFDYKESEVRAYRDYVAGGGNVLLVHGFVRNGSSNVDKIAKEFGIVFSKSVTAATIRRWAQHPLTKDLDLMPYKVGSVVTESPIQTVPLAYLDDDQIVMGIVKIGKGKVIFLSTTSPLLAGQRLFIKRVLGEFASKK